MLVEDVIPPADLQPLIDEFNKVIDRKAREAQAGGRLNDLFEDEPFERRLARIYNAMDDPHDLWRAVHGKNHKTAGMFAVITHPAILDIVESLIGPEVLAHPQFNARAKLPDHDPSMPTGRDVPGFIARSRENPESVAGSHLDWLKLMEEAGQAS